MAIGTVAARELAVLVKLVRALLRKDKKQDAIELVHEHTGCGLNECENFVEHVHLWPGAKAMKVAELWTNSTSVESITNTQDAKAKPAGTSNGAAPKRPSGTGISLAEWYMRFMETHSYSQREELVERCLAAKKTEDEEL